MKKQAKKKSSFHLHNKNERQKIKAQTEEEKCAQEQEANVKGIKIGNKHNGCYLMFY